MFNAQQKKIIKNYEYQWQFLLLFLIILLCSIRAQGTGEIFSFILGGGLQIISSLTKNSLTFLLSLKMEGPLLVPYWKDKYKQYNYSFLSLISYDKIQVLW